MGFGYSLVSVSKSSPTPKDTISLTHYRTSTSSLEYCSSFNSTAFAMEVAITPWPREAVHSWASWP